MGWNGNILTAPISLGDITYATGRTSQDLGDMIMYGTTIKTMAKYKPVRSSNPGILSLSERAATRYGFGTSLPQLSLADNEPQNIWTYLRPRGVSYNEWFRALDFDGYDSDACAPLAVGVGQLTYDDWSNINVFVNGYSNSIRTDGRMWVADHSLSLSELLESGSDYYGAYVSFLLIDTQTWEKNLIVTNTTFRALVNDGGGGIFWLNAQGGTDSGLTYSAIPILSSSRAGRIFRVIVCLLPGMQPSSGNAYAVYSSNITSYIPYSLEFESGADRASAKLESGQFRMDGTTMSAITINATDMAIERTYQGNVYRAFLISSQATFSTENVSYSGTDKTISGTLTLSNGGGFVFGPEPGSGNSSIQLETAVSLTGGTAGQTRVIGTTDSQQYLWIMKYQGSLISTTVSASASYTYPFNTPLTGSGQTTIS